MVPALLWRELSSFFTRDEVAERARAALELCVDSLL